MLLGIGYAMAVFPQWIDLPLSPAPQWHLLNAHCARHCTWIISFTPHDDIITALQMKTLRLREFY